MQRFILFLLLYLALYSLKPGDYKYLPSAGDGNIVRHENYALSYSEQYEQALWVAYQLTKEEIRGRFHIFEDKGLYYCWGAGKQ